jgi:tetratricopeptide (TPR) repeat protein
VATTANTLQRALAVHQSGQLAQAESMYRAVLEEEPDNFDALQLLAVIENQRNRYVAAAELIGRALRLNPDAPSAHLNLGNALLNLKRPKEALESYDRALAINPNYAVALYNRGNALLNLKRPEEALASYDRALAIKPTYPEALYNRGNTLIDLKRLGQALLSYDRALAIKPHYPEALYNRGNALIEFKRPSEALASYDRALAIKPYHAGALNNRGNALRDLKRHEEALASYDRALMIRPDYAEAFYNRGNVLLDLDRHDDSIVDYRKALALNPEYAQAYHGLGLALQAMGRYAEALEHFRKALAIVPDYGDAQLSLGIIFEELGWLKEAQSAFERAIAIDPENPRYILALVGSRRICANEQTMTALAALECRLDALVDDDRILLHFALGKALSDIGEDQKSFRHVLAGNTLKRRMVHYNELAELGALDRTKAIISSSLMQSKRGMGNPSELPIFIVGMPRSGSTLVEQILASHPRVFGAGERSDFSDAMRCVGLDDAATSFPESANFLTDTQLKQLGTDYVDRLLVSARRLGATAEDRITDKMPMNFRFLGLIHMALPNARIIHIRRNSVDTCLSCFSTLFVAGLRFVYDLGELGRYYRAYATLTNHWAESIPRDVMLEVQYEELITDFEPQARRIIAHCGLEWDSACLSYHLTQRVVRTASRTQVRKPIYRDSLRRKRPDAELLQPLLEALNLPHSL